jgi:predicted Ser/Thr protein kinase
MSGMLGQQIGKYRVTRELGRGGMGTVYAAIDETLHRDVAIKVLNAGLDDPTVARRFRAEAVTVARLNHPGIATIFELFQYDGQWLMVMEFVRGETLEQAVAAEGPLPVARASELVMQMLAALAHAHGLGVVHRDLKPANLMLMAGGGLKIMDFGIARVAGGEQLTSAGFMMGTPAYMAPEQVLGRDIDARTDLYAVGLVFYHMVTGVLPFKGSTPIQTAQARIHESAQPLAAVRPDLPAWLGHVLDIALQREPSDRFQTATEFREAVRRGAANLPFERPVAAAPPPELMATAAPNTLPVAAPLLASRRTEAPVADLPTVATAAPPAEQHASSRGRRRAVSFVVAAVSVVALVGAGLWLLRRPDQAGVSQPSLSAPSTRSAPSAPSAASPAEQAVVGAGGLQAPQPAGISQQSALAARQTLVQPAAGPIPAERSAALVAAPAAAPSGAALPPAPSPAPLVGRGRAASAGSSVSAEFPGIRALVLTGRRAEERPATLRFADGTVTLGAERGSDVIASLTYAQVTSAAYTRARHPKWFPTLAGPPVDADMPGGLFRGDRHWLALQSRDGYLIFHMNDSDRQRIVQTVESALGLKVAELRP